MRSAILHRDLLLLLSGVLLIVGLVLLASASTVASFQRFGSGYFYLKHQILFGILPGLILFLVARRLPRAFWERIAPWFYIASLLLLLALFIPGMKHFGLTKSWFIVGPFSFQPSEIAKFALILMLAHLAQRHGSTAFSSSRGTWRFLLITSPMFVLLALQPDIGTLSVLVGTALVVYFLGGGRFIVFGLFFLLAATAFGILAVASPHRLARLAVFWNDQYDPQGAGYQLRQALIAIGSGGLWGKGIGHSMQKYQYLPEVQSDSLFAIAAEELGFVLTAGLLFLIAMFWRTLFRLSLACEDRFSRLAIAGILVWFVLQTFLNTGAMMGLLPLTGVPLPLISYGGTAMVMELVALGFVMAVTQRR